MRKQYAVLLAQRGVIAEAEAASELHGAGYQRLVDIQQALQGQPSARPSPPSAEAAERPIGGSSRRPALPGRDCSARSTTSC